VLSIQTATQYACVAMRRIAAFAKRLGVSLLLCA
jgi:hypothetical protein